MNTLLIAEKRIDSCLNNRVEDSSQEEREETTVKPGADELVSL